MQLTIKFNALKECENIETYRRHMSKWRNSRWNHIGRNPNFLKMNYLIARAKEEEKENELFTSVERLDSKDSNPPPKGLKVRTHCGYRGFLSLSKQKLLTEH